jgi:type IX secretion system PorP/SprF family membrane protein
MRTLNAFLTLVFFVVFSVTLNAQTLNFWNAKSISNPAFSGLIDDEELIGSFRSDFFKGNTFQNNGFINYNRKSDRVHGGIGVYLSGNHFSFDNSFVTSYGSNLGLNYSYHLKLGDFHKIGIGVAASMYYQEMNWHESSTYDDERKIGLTLNTGVAYTYKKFSLGVSAFNLYRLNSVNTDISAQYVFDIGEKFSLTPQLNHRYYNSGFQNLQVNLQSLINQKYMLGFGVRSRNVICLFIGYQLPNKLSFGYSGGIQTSKLASSSYYMHELQVRYLFGKTK